MFTDLYNHDLNELMEKYYYGVVKQKEEKIISIFKKQMFIMNAKISVSSRQETHPFFFAQWEFLLHPP